MPRKVMNLICSAARKEKSRNSSWMTDERPSKNAGRVIGSRFISEIYSRIFRDDEGRWLIVNHLPFLLKCVKVFKKNLYWVIKHETVST